MVATTSHDVHRKRRGTLANFSEISVRNVKTIVKNSLDKLLLRLELVSKTVQEIPMSYVFKTATSDIIAKYAFGNSINFIDLDDHNMPFFHAIEQTFLLSPVCMQFPWLSPLMKALPLRTTKAIAPGLADMWKFREGLAQVNEVKRPKDKDASKDMIFDGVLNSNLPEEEKFTARLGHEAQLTVFAGGIQLG